MESTVRVLHVEDEPDIAYLTQRYLENEGEEFDVESVTDASEGIERLSEDGFDCVVTDYEMPDMDGIELLERVRDTHPDLPFILFTGKGSEEIASDAISAGVTDYLQKGGSEKYEILAKRIRNYVEKRRVQRQRQRQLDAIETAQEGISILDDGVFVYVNEAYAEMYGYEPEEMVGEGWELIYRDEDIERVEEEILPKVEENGSWRGETTGMRSDGSTFVEDHTLATTDEGGLVCTVRDITDRKRRERRLEAVFDNTYTFVGLLDIDGTLLEANQTALSFGGLEREDVVGKRVWDTYWFRSNDEARAASREAVEKARSGELYRDEVRVRGSEREAVIDFTIRPITDETGEVTLLVPEGRDITERKRYVRRLETLIDNLPGMVYRCKNEPGWTMENVRGEAERVTGYSPSTLENREEIYGTEVIHPEDREEVWDAVQEAVEDRELFEITYRIVTQEGDTKWVFERGQGIYTSEGDVEAIEGFIMNIMERE
jgi:PAS domain S-box-containing protein